MKEFQEEVQEVVLQKVCKLNVPAIKNLFFFQEKGPNLEK